MSDQNVRASDPRNYQLAGKVSLWFRKAGSSDDSDWKDLGNVVNPELMPTLTRLDHFSNRRGVRAKDKSLITERSANLNLTIDEINLPNLQFAFMSNMTPDDDEVDTMDDRIFVNPGNAGVITIGQTGLNVGSIIVRSINHEEEVTYVAGVDYTVDEAAGTITITAGALASNDPDTGVPEVHVQWAKAAGSQSFEIFPGTDLNGQAQLQVLTDEGIKVVATFGNVNMRNNGSIKIGDGQKYEEIGLQLEILEDVNGKLGTLHVIDAGDLP